MTRWIWVYATTFVVAIFTVLLNISCMVLNTQAQTQRQQIKNLQKQHRQLTLTLWETQRLDRLDQWAASQAYVRPKRVMYLNGDD